MFTTKIMLSNFSSPLNSSIFLRYLSWAVLSPSFRSPKLAALVISIWQSLIPHTFCMSLCPTN